VAFVLLLVLMALAGSVYLLHRLGTLEIRTVRQAHSALAWLGRAQWFLRLFQVAMVLDLCTLAVLTCLRLQRFARKRRAVITAIRAAATADEHRSGP